MFFPGSPVQQSVLIQYMMVKRERESVIATCTVSDGSVSGNCLKSRNLCSGTKITGWPVPKIVLTLV